MLMVVFFLNWVVCVFFVGNDYLILLLITEGNRREGKRIIVYFRSVTEEVDYYDHIRINKETIKKIIKNLCANEILRKLKIKEIQV